MTKEEAKQNKETGPEQSVFVGLVVSDKMHKTRVIEVHSNKTHPKYHKTYTVTKRFVAHDPENRYKVGDIVQFKACRPHSKLKKFEIIGKV